MDTILVVKLGGSSAATPDFPRWIQALEKAVDPVVVVPGGGPFANTVRRYQPRLGYGDGAAHRMTVLAMEQFGLALASLGTRMQPVASEDDMHASIKDGRIPVWMPASTALEAAELAEDWAVTSDSIAAWLASRLLHARLLLVKQIDLPVDSTLEALAGAKIVDDSFLSMLHPAVRVHVAGPADLPLAGRRLAEGVIPGHEVTQRRLMLDAAQ